MATLLPLTPEQLAENKGPHVITGCLTVAILATIAVVLRLLARRLQKSTIGADDYLILLALVRSLSLTFFFHADFLEAFRMGDLYSYFSWYYIILKSALTSDSC